MSDIEPDSEEAMTKEELQDTQPPAREPPQNASAPVAHSHTPAPITSSATTDGSIVAMLMAPKPKAKPPTSSSSASAASVPRMSHPNPFKDRMGLGAYLQDPASLPPSLVICHSAGFVAVRDKFPKATVHTLLLPRDPAVNLRHPFDALADPAFLAFVQAEVRRLRALVAAELRRRLGPYSRADAAREAVLNGEVAAGGEVQEGGGGGGGGGGEGCDAQLQPQLPPGRDWEAEVLVGVHAVPSMRHLHIHVLSRDMHSASLKHRKHYNSFNTPFLVDVADFPLAADDPRRDPKGHGYLRRDLVCWRCKRNFKNHFKELKEHLDEEFEAWKRE
ncbi:aprataxin-like protein [Purpureocillium lavendulum]|uniref:Aprataxin-like protein n=1 Tax=Purpureocillium lavendulum TaxID=1247861 RepID=A0AB34FIE5_9HYPO|nr:aprataxin-like protein [Purpureocillium lavendulum]